MSRTYFNLQVSASLITASMLLGACYGGGGNGPGSGGSGGTFGSNGGTSTSKGGASQSTGGSSSGGSTATGGSTAAGGTFASAGTFTGFGGTGTSGGTLEELCSDVCASLNSSCPTEYNPNCESECLGEVAIAREAGCATELQALGDCCLTTEFPATKCVHEGVGEVASEDCDDDDMCPAQGATYVACAYP